MVSCVRDAADFAFILLAKPMYAVVRTVGVCLAEIQCYQLRCLEGMERPPAHSE